MEKERSGVWGHGGRPVTSDLFVVGEIVQVNTEAAGAKERIRKKKKTVGKGGKRKRRTRVSDYRKVQREREGKDWLVSEADRR